MLVKTDVLFDEIKRAVDEHLVPKYARRRFRGSFPRKRLLAPVTDVDVEVSISNARDIPEQATRTIRRPTPFTFLSAECGERASVVPPWRLADDGALQSYCRVEAEEWMDRLAGDVDLPASLTTDLKALLSSGDKALSPCTITTGILAKIELLVRPVIGIMWSIDDLHRGFQTVDGKSVHLKELVANEKRSLSVDYAYSHTDSRGTDFCVVQLVYVDGGVDAPRGGSELRRTALKYLADDAPAIFKDLRWIVPPRLLPLYHSVDERVEWDMAIAHRRRYLALTTATRSRREKIHLPGPVHDSLKTDASLAGGAREASVIIASVIREMRRLSKETFVGLPESRRALDALHAR